MTGLFQHYKGNFYRVLGITLREADMHPMVHYQPDEGGHVTYVRPVEDFFAFVEVHGQMIPRFAFVNSLTRKRLQTIKYH